MQFRNVVVDEELSALRLVVVVLLLAGEAVCALPLRVVVAECHAEGNAVFAEKPDQRIDRRLKAAARIHIAVLPADIVAREDEKRRTKLCEGGAKRLLDARVELAVGRLQMEVCKLQEAKLPVVSNAANAIALPMNPLLQTILTPPCFQIATYALRTIPAPSRESSVSTAT